MKKIIFSFLCLLFGFNLSFSYSLIPQPAEYVVNKGEFAVPKKWFVDTELPKGVSESLLGILKHDFKINSKEKANLILKKNPAIQEEGYSLDIKEEAITLSASTERGFFYGLQSLYQICYLAGGPDNIPCGEISDYPRYRHRGLMLDVARYFIPKEEVMKLIDVASALKINTLHLHLTDDNGWRMEIKKYPKLTEIGAWRVDRPEIFPGRINQKSADEPTPIGGFYTQEDLKEIVAYAAAHHINVIPEIEMPAHAAAAIAAYPSLACPVVDKFVGVFPGIGGPDASIIMCGGNDKVYEFYRDVLDEVMEVFPSEYIHLGGDEANKRYWEECELCNKRISELGLKDYEELQAYFMDTINSYVRSKGRTAMGWDEVTYGNPKEDMVILGWQGTGNVAVNDAKKSGRKFIMTPAQTLYLIRYQGPQWFEPLTYFGNNTLSDVYNYEPVKDDWTPELEEQLLGVQGSLWTEFCSSNQDVEYLIFPRLMAVADMAWRPKGSQDWSAFLEALDNYLPELDQKDVTYAKSMFNIQHTARPDGKGVTLAFESIRPDLDIIYTSGNDSQTSEYEAPVELTESALITANTYKDGRPMGKDLILEINFNDATGHEVTALNSRNGLGAVLTNGIRGSNRNSDFEWAGWYGADAEFSIDLGEPKKIENVKLGALGTTNICVAFPESVELYVSDDGQNYSLIATETLPEELVWVKEPTIQDIDFGTLDTSARYLKFRAKNPGTIPQGFAREGNPSWIYFDEVMVNP